MCEVVRKLRRQEYWQTTTPNTHERIDWIADTILLFEMKEILSTGYHVIEAVVASACM
jgi:hypothetical protein